MTPTRIILHHSLTKDGPTVSWQAIRTYHINTNHWDDIGYHFGVEIVKGHYEVLVGRMLDETGAHTRGYNSTSIGVCLVGNFDHEPPPDPQWELAVRLVRGLLVVTGIPAWDVLGHHDFDSHKSCPGASFDMRRFRADITEGGT